MDKRLKVNPDLCFICQEEKQINKVTSQTGEFDLCADCTKAVQQEEATRNRIKSALYNSEGGRILQYTLGMDLISTRRVKVEPIKD